MCLDYKCSVSIKLDGGDVQIAVSDGDRMFTYISGVGFVALRQFFGVLTDFYYGSIDSYRLDNIGFYDYYIFSIEGNNLLIKHFSHEQYPEQEIYDYVFDYQKYVTAVKKGFSEYLQQLHQQGVLPLEVEDSSSPVSKEVLEFFHKLASIDFS